MNPHTEGHWSTAELSMAMKICVYCRAEMDFLCEGKEWFYSEGEKSFYFEGKAICQSHDPGR